MNTTLKTYVAGAVIAGSALPVAAQSDISPVHKWSWSENAGWMNWRDAGNPAGASGVSLPDDFLSGFIWAENLGWINMGDGTPANGNAYANSTGSDFGVNIDPTTGDLYGFAWGENIGWINFDTRSALTNSGQQARFDFAGERFRGYAWGENIGWINLDDDTHFVALGCIADFVPDGMLNFFDVQAFLNAFSAHNLSADLATDGVFDFFDVQAYLNYFSAGCP